LLPSKLNRKGQKISKEVQGNNLAEKEETCMLLPFFYLIKNAIFIQPTLYEKKSHYHRILFSGFYGKVLEGKPWYNRELHLRSSERRGKDGVRATGHQDHV
jgi:hypothetical protein